MKSKPLNRSLHAARDVKQDEFYTLAVIVDHMKDENNDGATDIEDVKLFLKRNQANRIALKGNEQYPGGDFRSPEYVDFLDQADIIIINPPFSLALACSIGYTC